MATQRPGFPTPDAEAGAPDTGKTAAQREVDTLNAINEAGIQPASHFAHFRSLNVPDSVVAGDTFRVSGTIHMDAISANLVAIATRVRITSPHLGEAIARETGSLNACQTSTFAVDLQAPSEPGQVMTVTLEPQYHEVGPFGNWESVVSPSTFNIDVVTQAEQARNIVTDIAPWVVGGSAIGGGVGSVGGPGLATGAVLGAGVGAGAFGLASQNVLPRFTFPTIPVIATAGLLGAGALLISQLPDDPLPDVDVPSRSQLPGTPASS